MKKRVKDVLVISIFLASTIISTFLFVDLNNRRDRETLNIYKQSFTTIINLTAEMLSEGYFMWDEMYYAFIDDRQDFIDEYMAYVEESSAYIKYAHIEESNPLYIKDEYLILNTNNSLYIDLPITDNSMNQYIEDKIVRVSINASAVLESFAQGCDYSFTKGRKNYPFAYGMEIKSSRPPIAPFQIISALAIGFLAALIGKKILYSYANYFYETRGLEKIISLFEHTERFSANHSKHVSTIAYILGRHAGFSGRNLKDLKVAALLHDIGKISIPRELLNKKEKLTEEEFALIKEHPKLSDNILKSFEELSHLRPYIRYHHEKMDGSGYPEGLKGEEIPIQSRIIAIADIFEALTGERPYRDPMPPNSAVKLMKTMHLDDNILRLLDQNLMDICLKIDRRVF